MQASSAGHGIPQPLSHVFLIDPPRLEVTTTSTFYQVHDSTCLLALREPIYIIDWHHERFVSSQHVPIWRLDTAVREYIVCHASPAANSSSFSTFLHDGEADN